MLLRGSKLYIVNQLREIAQHITHTDYPEVTLINNPMDPTLANRPGLFIKRSFSDSGKHVLRASNPQDVKKIHDMVEETNTFYNHDSLRKIGAQPKWFGIAFIPEMLEKGEIKVYFIGGKLSYMVSTTPLSDGNLRIKQVFELTPLHHLSYVLLQNSLFPYLIYNGSQENGSP
jgi:hypothetical protein